MAAIVATNLLPVAEAVRKQHPNANIIVAADDDWKTIGNPGLTCARKAARAIGAMVAKPDFGQSRRDKDTDFNDLADLLGTGHVEQGIVGAVTADALFEQLIMADPHSAVRKEYLAEFSELQKRDVAAFERLRAALKSAGVRAKVFDEALAKQQRKDDSEDERENGELKHWKIDLWPDPVGGAVVLDEVVALVKKHISMPKHTPEACALWVMHTWCIDVVDCSPFLAVTSPMLKCGKTSLLGLLNWLTRRSQISSNISPAALYRFIDLYHPTLLIDEMDSFLSGNEELRGLLNSGHTRVAAYVIRCEGDSLKPRYFSTWAPKVLTLIGQLPDTLQDRSIGVPMRRRMPGEKVERLRVARDAEVYQVIRRKLARWARDNMPSLQDPPDLEIMDDRAMDNWRPLLSIANQAGGTWPERAKQAALALSGPSVSKAADRKIELLRDIREVFMRKDKDEIPSRELVAELAMDEERPWHSYGRSGKPLTQRQLAGLLRPFGIISVTVHPEGQPHASGYKRVDFADAFARYLPPDPTEPPEPTRTPDPPPPSEPPKPSGNGSGSTRTCAQCNATDGTKAPYVINGKNVWLHRACVTFYRGTHH